MRVLAYRLLIVAICLIAVVAAVLAVVYLAGGRVNVTKSIPRGHLLDHQ